jgi:type III secretion system HrpB4-like protein
MQVDMNVQSPAGVAAAWLAALERNRATAIEWIDRSWWPDWLSVGALDAGSLTQRDCANALARALAVPPLDAALVFECVDTRQHRCTRLRQGMALAALPIVDQLRIARLRSLVFRRAEVRRIVDRDRRTRLAASLGDEGGVLLRWLGSVAGAPEISALRRSLGIGTLESLDETGLAWEGYCLFERDGVLASGSAHGALLRLALPRALSSLAWLERCPPGLDADGSELVSSRLPLLYPEFAWSFGCEIPTSN